ncbi:hypothetical protein DK37_19435 [Halomonas sp. SUBG004]|nr:hypothetical protein DK37_19435 [Halomonas sp. SUBG004]
MNQQATYSLLHMARAYGKLIQIRLSINDTEDHEADRPIASVSGHQGKPEFNGMGPPLLFGYDKRMPLLDINVEPSTNEQLTRIIVDGYQRLQLINVSSTQRYSVHDAAP